MAKISLKCNKCPFKKGELKQRKGRRRLSTLHSNNHPLTNIANDGVDHNENNQEVVQQKSIETVLTTTKVPLQCDLCSFRTATLKRSKARQRLYSHRYSHILNIDQFQYSVEKSDNMDEEDQGDDFEMARENTDQEPSYIVVNGDKLWLVNYGLV